MLANLTVDLIFDHVDSESPPIDTPLLSCLMQSFCGIISKGFLNSSTEPLVRPSRRYVAASIISFFVSDRQMLQARNYIINSAILSPTILEGPSWKDCLSQVCRYWKTVSETKKISSSIILRRTIPTC